MLAGHPRGTPVPSPPRAASRGICLSLLILAISSCGVEPDENELAVEEPCFGVSGTYDARPTLALNSCMNTPTVLPTMELVVEDDDDVKRCGWHDLSVVQRDSWLAGCRDSIRHSLHTLDGRYSGLIVLEMTCSNGSGCAAVWQLDFKWREPAVPPGRM